MATDYNKLAGKASAEVSEIDSVDEVSYIEIYSKTLFEKYFVEVV